MVLASNPAPELSSPAPMSATRAMLRARFRTVREMPLAAVILLSLLGVVAIFADIIAPHDPTLPVENVDPAFFAPPVWLEGGSSTAILGTDFQGRDVFSRLVHGSRVSIIVGLVGTLVAAGIGTAMGVLSGYLGGWADTIIMRITDAWLALPALIFAIFLATLVGPSMWNIVIILGAVFWTRYARVIRGEVLSACASVSSSSSPRLPGPPRSG